MIGVISSHKGAKFETGIRNLMMFRKSHIKNNKSVSFYEAADEKVKPRGSEPFGSKIDSDEEGSSRR